MRDIFQFKFNGNQVRVFKDAQGEPWFVAYEICRILQYDQPRKAVVRHCKGGMKRTVLTAGGPQEVTTIPESDLYRLIMKSHMPDAEEFQDWVVEEVLPQIRKTGGYIPVEEGMSDIEILSRAVLIAQKTIEEQKRKIEEYLPKVEAYQDLMDSEGLYSIRDAGNILGMTSHVLNQFLRDQGLLSKERDDSGYINRPTKLAREMDILVTKAGSTRRYGTLVSYQQTKVTPVGLDYLRKLLRSAA